MKKLLFAIPLAAALALAACGTKPEAAAPQSMARISVQGNKFVNADGDTVTFRGLCLADEPGAHIPVMATDEYGEHITKYFEERGINFTIWCFDKDYAPTLFKDWESFTPTTQGRFFKKYLQGLKK